MLTFVGGAITGGIIVFSAMLGYAKKKEKERRLVWTELQMYKKAVGKFQCRE